MNNEIYVGQDPLINFGEKNTFGGELRTGKTFGIKFSNATAADVNVAICPADFHKLTDIQKKFAGVKAILKSGEIANIAGNKFMAASLDPNNSIDEFMKWIKSNPSRITDLYIESDKAEFFATTIYQKDVEPYSDKGDKRVVLSEYIKSGDYNQERKHIPLWKKMEAAKRRALYTLKSMKLPLETLSENPESGLSFDFTTDRDVNDHFASTLKNQEAVFTGHDCGHITINLAEADEVARSHTKLAMGEKYRTLLGHFRHELGHYYFDKLIACSPAKHALCKQYFGDDELSYKEALDKHYKQGAPENWRDSFISEYATMHPYEDWAETWSHYMHIMDTLETAKNFSITGSTIGNPEETEEVGELTLPQDAYFFSAQTSITSILDTWMDFAIILNSLNRSMGMGDAYPFVLTQPVRTKLAFIHHAIHDRLNRMPDLLKESENTQ